MSRTTWWTALVAIIALPAASSCGDGPLTPPAPVPGTLIVSLETTGAPAGAVLMILKGEGIGAPTVIDPAQQLLVRKLDAAGTTYRVAVIGERVSGPLFSFAVPDVTRPEAYSVTLLEVADEMNGLQADIDGYGLAVHRARQPQRVESLPSIR